MPRREAKPGRQSAAALLTYDQISVISDAADGGGQGRSGLVEEGAQSVKIERLLMPDSAELPECR